MSDLLERGRAASDKLLESVESELRSQLSGLRIDLSRLDRQLAELNRRVAAQARSTGRGPQGGGQARDQAVPAKKAPAKKAAAKKAPAKKTRGQEGAGQEGGGQEGAGQEGGGQEGGGQEGAGQEVGGLSGSGRRCAAPLGSPPWLPDVGSTPSWSAAGWRPVADPGPGRHRRRSGPGGRRAGRQAGPPGARRASRSWSPGPGPRFVSRAGEKLDAALDRFGVDVAGPARARRRRLHRRLHRLRPATRGGRRWWRSTWATASSTSGWPTIPGSRCWSAPTCAASTRRRVGEPVDLVVADLSFISLRLGARCPARPCCVPTATWSRWSSRSSRRAARSCPRAGASSPTRPCGPTCSTEVLSALDERGATIMGLMASPITGSDGNVEFVLHARPGPAPRRGARLGPALDLVEPAVAEAEPPDRRGRPHRSHADVAVIGLVLHHDRAEAVRRGRARWPPGSTAAGHGVRLTDRRRGAGRPRGARRRRRGVRRRARPGRQPRRRRHHAAHRGPGGGPGRARARREPRPARLPDRGRARRSARGARAASWPATTPSRSACCWR